MKKKLTTLTALFLSTTVLGLNIQTNQALAQKIKIEATIAEDNLNNLQGLPWGGDKFPYSKITRIEDTLNPEDTAGFMVMDRHGIDESEKTVAPTSNSSNSSNNSIVPGVLGIFNRRNSSNDSRLGRDLSTAAGVLQIGLANSKQPFSEPAPGKQVYISAWGAKDTGCFAEIIMQLAPKGNFKDSDFLIKEVEMGLGSGRQLKLKPPTGVTPKTYRGNYTYTVSNNSLNSDQEANFLVSKTSLGMNKDAALLLMNAPKREVKARIVLANGSIIMPIGIKTVERWKKVFSVNPTCENLRQ